MRIIVWIGLLTALLVVGNDVFTPKTTFDIAKADRPVTSAELKLCGRTWPLEKRGAHLEVAVRVPGDCDGEVSAMMIDRERVSCLIGYVSAGDGDYWHFSIAGDKCDADVTYPHLRQDSGG